MVGRDAAVAESESGGGNKNGKQASTRKDNENGGKQSKLETVLFVCALVCLQQETHSFEKEPTFTQAHSHSNSKHFLLLSHCQAASEEDALRETNIVFFW